MIIYIYMYIYMYTYTYMYRKIKRQYPYIGQLLHFFQLCVAACCSVLHCVASISFNFVEQWVALCCGVMQCVAVCCSVLQCVAVCCSVLQCVAVCCRHRILHFFQVCHSSINLFVTAKRRYSAKEPYKRDDILQKRPIKETIFCKRDL